MLKGKIIRGAGIGKSLGFPTANLEIKPTQVYLGTGVYAAYAELDNIKYEAALIVMPEKKSVEAHLLGYEGEDFYGSVLTCSPIQKVSEIEDLSFEDLPEKISNDIKLIQRVLENIG